jgi:hypothetical protein
MAAPLDPQQVAALDLARRIVREAAIHGVRPEFYMVDVVGSVIAVIKATRGADYALTVNGHGAWECALFRNEGFPKPRLIREAISATRAHGSSPAFGLVVRPGRALLCAAGLAGLSVPRA